MIVLIVHRYMSLYGGAENVIKEFSVRLSKLGIENAVISLNISKEIEQLCGGVNTDLVYCPNPSLPIKVVEVFRNSN